MYHLSNNQISVIYTTANEKESTFRKVPLLLTDDDLFSPLPNNDSTLVHKVTQIPSLADG